MKLELELRTTPEVPLEADVLSFDRLRGLDAAAVEHLQVLHGNQACAVADFFKVTGKCEESIHLHGDLSRVKYLGAAMSSGRMHVHGSAGAHLGAAMQGGTIEVDGSAGDWVGPEMRGGRIHIHGDAGHLVGAALRGSPSGMTGGEILVDGQVRNELGHGMRNGLIAVGGDAGDFPGVNMLAGTILVMGHMGNRAGASMKRGTIVSMHGAELLPTFSNAGTLRPLFMTLYLLHLRDAGLVVSEEQLHGAYERWCGDAVELNRGEILLYKQ